jgi:putative oligomerization/nucleic acid binding protein
MTAAVFDAGHGRAKIIVGGRTDQRGNPFAGGSGQIYAWGESRKIANKLLERLDSVVPETPEPATAHSAAPASVSEELQRLAELHAKGVLDDTEFRAAKARLLG